MTGISPVTRRVARIVLATIKKIGNSRGVTLKKIHDYIRDEYPNTPNDIVKLNNMLQKALLYGAVIKKNGKYVLSSVVKDVMDSKGRVKSYVINYGIRKVKKKVVKRKKPGRRAPSKKRKPKKRRGKK